MILELADNVAGTATAEASVESNATPFLPGRVVEAVIVGDGITGTDAVIEIESSPDDTVWTVVMTLTGLGSKAGNVKCDQYMRANVDTAGGTTPGTYSAWLSSGD